MERLLHVHGSRLEMETWHHRWSSDASSNGTKKEIQGQGLKSEVLLSMLVAKVHRDSNSFPQGHLDHFIVSQTLCMLSICPGISTPSFVSSRE